MKKNTISRVLGILVLLSFVFAAFGVSPVLAQGEDPVVPTVAPPVDNDPDVVVIPETGGQQNNDGLFSGWTLLIILGVAVVVLLIALVARSGHTHVD
jgi:hypothetical protein